MDLHEGDFLVKKKLKCSSLCDFAKKHDRESKHIRVRTRVFNVQKFCVMQLLNEPFGLLYEMEARFTVRFLPSL